MRLFPVDEAQERTLYAQLAADLRAHQPGVIGDLLAAFGAELQGVAYLIVRNHADAEEILMDTLATAWRRANDLRDDRALRTWLLRIATRHALSRRRRSRPTQPLEVATPIAAPDVDQPSLDRIVMADAMSELSPRVRAVIALHYLVALTVPEIAAVTRRSENTIKSQLREGRARLRIALAPAEADAEVATERTDA